MVPRAFAKPFLRESTAGPVILGENVWRLLRVYSVPGIGIYSEDLI